MVGPFWRHLELAVSSMEQPQPPLTKAASAAPLTTKTLQCKANIPVNCKSLRQSAEIEWFPVLAVMDLFFSMACITCLSKSAFRETNLPLAILLTEALVYLSQSPAQCQGTVLHPPADNQETGSELTK